MLKIVFCFLFISFSVQAKMTKEEYNQLNAVALAKLKALATSGKPIISPDKMAQWQAQGKRKANQQTPQIFCKAEIANHCPNALVDRLPYCLSEISRSSVTTHQCKTLLLQRTPAPSASVHRTYRNISIPQGSHFFYLKHLDTLGVLLSKPTQMQLNHQRITVEKEITWFLHGALRSFIPQGHKEPRYLRN